MFSTSAHLNFPISCDVWRLFELLKVKSGRIRRTPKVKEKIGESGALSEIEHLRIYRLGQKGHVHGIVILY
jgi:hypothetical protein